MIVGVYGASGCGRGIMPLVRGQYGTTLMFVDDGCAGTLVNGHRVVDWAGFLALDSVEKRVSIAIAASRVRT